MHLRTRNWEVDRKEVLEAVVPESTDTHRIVPHSYFVETSEELIEEENLELKETKYYMSKNQMKYFGKYTFDKKVYPEGQKDDEHNPNITMGFVNSHDKSLASCVFFGTRMPVCSNEGWHGRLWFKRKHIGNIAEDLNIGIKACILNLNTFSEGYAQIMENYKNYMIDDSDVRSLLVESANRNIIPSSKILTVYKEWLKPQFEYDDNNKNIYRLYNSFTTILRDYKDHAVTNPKRNFALLEVLNDVTGDSSEDVNILKKT